MTIKEQLANLWYKHLPLSHVDFDINNKYKYIGIKVDYIYRGKNEVYFTSIFLTHAITEDHFQDIEDEFQYIIRLIIDK